MCVNFIKMFHVGHLPMLILFGLTDENALYIDEIVCLFCVNEMHTCLKKKIPRHDSAFALKCRIKSNR